MCIAIHKPAGVKLEESVYQECFRRNDHGGGFAYVAEIKKDGPQGIVVDKGFFNAKDMIKAIKEEEDREMIIHFRRASCGGITADMCHPFSFTSRCFPQFSFALIHNGTLPYHNEKHKSDTACFVDEVLFPHLDRDPYFLDNKPGQFMLRCLIGKNNKFVVLRYNNKTNQTKVYIINDGEGVRAKGCWFSNSSFIPPSPAVGAYEGEWDFPLAPGRLWPDGAPVGGYILNEWGFWVRAVNNTVVKSPPEIKQVPKPLCSKPLAKLLDGASAISCIMSHHSKLQKEPLLKLPPEQMAKVEKAVAALEEREAKREKAKEVASKIVQFNGSEKNIKLPAEDIEEDAVVAFPKGAEGTATIEVPRDADVKTETHCLKKGAGIDHLSKREKRTLKKLCKEYLDGLGFGDSGDMDFQEQLSWVREDVRDAVKATDEVMTDKELDRWIIAEHEAMMKRAADENAKKEESSNLRLQIEAERAEALKSQLP